MESLSLLADGIWIALQPGNLLFAFLGVLIGTIVGVIPGIGPTTAIALLIPVSFSLDPGENVRGRITSVTKIHAEGPTCVAGGCLHDARARPADDRQGQPE